MTSPDLSTNLPVAAAGALAEFDHRSARGLLDEAFVTPLAVEAADWIIRHQRDGGNHLRDAVTLLCWIATHNDERIARAGITGIFPALIERLNDSFNPANCELYDQIFAQVIEFCRRLPEGRKLDDGLRGFGLMNEADLLARKTRIGKLKSQLPDPATFNSVRKVLLLSRVTIGADVAVNSPIIAKLREVLPQAEFVLLGSRKLRELYGGDERIRVREIAYERGGGLITRLSSWLNVLEAVDDERRGMQEDECWVIDPDSRLTQLGLLPIIKGDLNYFFFESRSYARSEEQGSIAELAARWSGELIGNLGPAFPFVALPEEHRNFGKAVAAKIRNPQSAIRNLTAISFGVGDNERKRVSEEFEEQLISQLVTGSKLILDKGASQAEHEQINRVTARLRAQGNPVVEINETNKAEIAGQDLFAADVVTWDGSIGAFAGLIAASCEYIGYDSAGQHIAAALGVPTLTVFVNSNNSTFAERWRPFGKGRIEVVTVEAELLAGQPDLANSILDQTLALHQRLKADN